jgi:hypothetical protein
MVTDRDELAELIDRYISDNPSRADSLDAADAILAAGWRAPARSPWSCGHEFKVGNWGHNGECIQCWAQSQRAPTCAHEWIGFGTMHPEAGPPWRGCSSCGAQEWIET